MKNQEFDVQEYTFQSFSAKVTDPSAKNYEFRDLREQIQEDFEAKEEIIRVERQNSINSGFDISPIVRQHRGIKKQEEDEIERRIQEEVQKRVAKIQDEAYRLGHEEGIEQGRIDILEQTRAAADEKIFLLTEMIHETLGTQAEILKNQKIEVYKLIRNLTKWIVLRELKEDGKYIERLLEKLILETQTKANLLIQVNQKYFEEMPEVLEIVQTRLGTLSNVRIESDYDIKGAGIIIQSENGIINATLSEQLKSLDKLFDGVGVEVNPEDNKIVDSDDSND